MTPPLLSLLPLDGVSISFAPLESSFNPHNAGRHLRHRRPDATPLAMEPRSGSRRSWADMAYAEEAARDAARSAYPELPPLTAAAHASLVLRTTSLDLDATPFSSPGAGYGDRLHFTDSEASFGDSDASPLQGNVGAPVPVLRRRWRRICRHRPFQGSLAAPPPSPAPVAHPSVLATHPPQMTGQLDADGFREVVSRRHWRRMVVQRRPVPANLVGKCFNCLSESHVKADCTSPPRCFHCLGEGHQERSYPALGRDTVKRGRSPAMGIERRGRGGRRRRSRESAAATVSGRSASTGRSPSVPPVCAPYSGTSPCCFCPSGCCGHLLEGSEFAGHR